MLPLLRPHQTRAHQIVCTPQPQLMVAIREYVRSEVHESQSSEVTLRSTHYLLQGDDFGRYLYQYQQVKVHRIYTIFHVKKIVHLQERKACMVNGFCSKIIVGF